jgi:hypothetical protein
MASLSAAPHPPKATDARATGSIIRAVVAHFAQQHPRPDRLACIGIDERSLDELVRAATPVDPPPRVLREAQSAGVAVEPASVCAYDDTNGFRVRGQRRSGGFILTLGAFRWISPDRVEVPIKYCCWIGWGTADLARSEHGWRVAQLKSWAQS